MPRNLTAVRPRRNTLGRDTAREIAWRYYARKRDTRIAAELRLPVRVIKQWRIERFLIAN